MNEAEQTTALALSRGDDLPRQRWGFNDSATDEEHPAADLATGLVSLGFIWAALRRSAKFCCATAVIGLLAGIGVFVKFPPTYQATASVLVTNNPTEQPLNAMLDNQTIAQSRTVAGDALRKLGLRQSVTSFVGDYTVIALTSRVLQFTVNAPSSADAVSRANALTSAFLTFQATQLEAQDQRVNNTIRQQITQAQQHLAALNGQISQLSAQSTSSAQAAKLKRLRTKQSRASVTLAALKQANIANRATTLTDTATVIQGSQILDHAVPVPQSRLKLRLIYAVTGLIVGLALGAGIIVVRALVSDRLRRRDDVAYALGAPVKLGVGKVRLSRWRPGSRGLAAARDTNIRRIVAHLGGIVDGGFHGPAALAVVPVDSPQVAALSLVSLAVTYAEQHGLRIVVADLCTGAPAARLLGNTDPGVRKVSVHDAHLVVVVPDPDDVAPAGPLQRGPAEAQATDPLSAAFSSADLLLTLAALDPSLGAEHLAGWASGAVAVVTAGQSSAVRIRAVGEMIRLSGTELISAVLVGADKTDESLGVVQTPGAMAQDTSQR